METMTLLPGVGISGSKVASTDSEALFTNGSVTLSCVKLVESDEGCQAIGIASNITSSAEGCPKSKEIVLLPGFESICKLCNSL